MNDDNLVDLYEMIKPTKAATEANLSRVYFNWAYDAGSGPVFDFVVMELDGKLMTGVEMNCCPICFLRDTIIGLNEAIMDESNDGVLFLDFDPSVISYVIAWIINDVDVDECELPKEMFTMALPELLQSMRKV